MEKYRPCNGSEGEWFRRKFCEQCQHDIQMNCQILVRTLMNDKDDPDYPTEWIKDENGPRCTAFEEIAK